MYIEKEITIQMKEGMTMLSGVYKAQKKDGTFYFRSSITFKSKHISLGSFPSEEEAAAAYQLADKILHDVSYTEKSFSQSRQPSPLPFTKWIILLNYRDNGIYIKTPVYLKKHYFHYYFAKDDFLTFDTDDLFYYSTRTISRRGGHLFVADYGMQVNILSRYGIKNYAVEGRDFRFINGDSRDFRYSNIEIINRFQGVEKKEKAGTVYYETKIHGNGNFVVGRYETETEAAIAYNKAASILITKGYMKEYPVNYLEELTTSQYREIYKRITVSPHLKNLKPLQ